MSGLVGTRESLSQLSIFVPILDCCNPNQLRIETAVLAVQAIDLRAGEQDPTEQAEEACGEQADN
jgi:hypothetical protein